MDNAIQNIKNMIFPTSDPYKISGEFGNSTLEPTVTAALRVLHETPSEFNTLYFSRKNVDFIQSKLISQTKKFTGVDIGRQTTIHEVQYNEKQLLNSVSLSKINGLLNMAFTKSYFYYI